LAPPISASPELHTESEKKAMAVNSDRKEPTTRPCTPKCAPEDTALLVPLIGPNSPMGARISEPSNTPSTIAQTPRLERQAEQYREAAEYGGGKGVGTTEDHSEQVRRACGAFAVRDLFDPVGFNLRKALVFVVVIHDLLRS
jgi:hypothetical protein